MTAPEPNSSRSDNSVSRSARKAENGSQGIAPRHDPQTHRIVDYTLNNRGSVTRRDLSTETGWPLREVDHYLERLATAGYVELIEDVDSCIILLTHEGEQLAQNEVAW